MKKIALFITCIALACAPASAQSLLERLGQRAKNAAENNLGNKVEKGVNDILNGKGKKEKTKDTKDQQEQPVQQTATPQNGTWTCPNPECGHAGNTGNFCTECGTKKPADGTVAAQTVPQNKQVQTAYAKTDFVPGDEVFFADDLENEQMGEFPSRWDAREGNAEVAEIEHVACILLNDKTVLEPLMEKQEAYLPDVYTVEMDLWIPETGKGVRYSIQSISGARFENPGYSILIAKDNDSRNRFDCSVAYLTPSGESRSTDVYKQTEVGDTPFQPGAWNHISLSFNKRALKVYANGTRLANIANCQTKPRLTVGGQYEYQSGLYAMSNFRMAKGAVPLYDRLASDGKIVTYAITFDTGKATLKPEADVEINRIKGIMDKDPSLKFEVQGHCDNTGSDAVNDPLSQKRAEAIVARLVELGIAKDRLTAVGKGSHEPIADNSTDEDRAKNRRVEFVKK